MPQVSRFELGVRPRHCGLTTVGEREKRRGSSPHGGTPEVAHRGAANRGVQVVLGIVHRPVRSIVPNTREHTLDDIFSGVPVPWRAQDFVNFSCGDGLAARSLIAIR